MLMLDFKARVKKNIVTDLVGDKVGRIHLGKQDMSKMQSRKMKGLKRSRDDARSQAADDLDEETLVDAEEDAETKRSRVF
jgi:ribosome production factor 2